MSDLVTWLRAQLDEDEAFARNADGDEIVDYLADEAKEYEPQAAIHIRRWLPSRVLGEVAAKRRILDLHQRVDARDDWLGRQYPDWPEQPACYGCHANFREEYAVEDANDCPVARLLALPYADRPGYLEEWRPDLPSDHAADADDR